MAKRRSKQTPIHLGFHVPSHMSPEVARTKILKAMRILFDDETYTIMEGGVDNEVVISLHRPTSENRNLDFFNTLQSLFSVTSEFTPHFTQWTKEDAK